MRLHFLALLWPALVAAAPPPEAVPVPPHVQRIADAARLWSRVQWVHPGLADGRIDWDRALLDAMPAIAEAGNDASRAAALRQVLEPLKDPAVRVGPAPAPTYVQATAGPPNVEALPGGVMLVSVHRPVPAWQADFPQRVAELQRALVPASALIFDLRPAEPSWFEPADLVNRLLTDFLEQPLVLPATRARMHQGYIPQAGGTSGGYFSAWLTQASALIVPSAAASARPVVFIVNEATVIPPAALAMQKSGLGYIVAEGTPSAAWFVPTQELDVGGLPVRFASGELVFEDGHTGFGSDLELKPSAQAGPGSAAVQGAVALLSRQPQLRPGLGVARRPLAPLARWQPDRLYGEASLPNLGLRRLAVIRFWSVIDNFFAYKSLLDRPWAEALPEFLARMDTVGSEREYALVIAEMAARLHDNHVRLRGASIDRAMGEAALPQRLAVVEDRVVVTEKHDGTAAADVDRWDEVLTIDGEPVAAAMARLERFVSWATPGTRDRNLTRSALGRGAEGTSARLQLRGADGRLREVTLPRSRSYLQPPRERRSGEVVKVLPGAIGYVDLDRLTVPEVDAMFEQLKDTRAIVFDMRGYPNGTAWSIAPRLNVKGAKEAAIFEPPQLFGGGGWEEPGRGQWAQHLPPGEGKPLYRGRVLMLIDARTQSQAEHTGLFFEAACDVVFVGSPSAGSNGDVTRLIIPGGLEVSFTGQGVRHADGRQLQRVGLRPHIGVAPTLTGLRAGRDEVLERALALVETGR